MSEATLAEAPAANTGDISGASLTYLLMILGAAGGILAAVGAVIASTKQGNAKPWLRSHYAFQMRTFWLGVGVWVLIWIAAIVAWNTVAKIDTVVPVAFALWGLLCLWSIVRLAAGFMTLRARKAHPRPETLLL